MFVNNEVGVGVGTGKTRRGKEKNYEKTTLYVQFLTHPHHFPLEYQFIMKLAKFINM